MLSQVNLIPPFTYDIKDTCFYGRFQAYSFSNYLFWSIL